MSSFEEGQTFGGITTPSETQEEAPVLPQQPEEPKQQEGISRARAASSRGRKP